MMMIAQEHICL